MGDANADQITAIIECQGALAVANLPCFLYFMTISNDGKDILTVSYNKDDTDPTVATLTKLDPPGPAGVENSIKGRNHN